MSSLKRFLVVGACVAFAIIVGLVFGEGCTKRDRPNPAAAPIQCRINLEAIDRVKQQWMTEHQKTTNDVPTWDDLIGYLSRDGDTIPTCPGGGSYTIGRVGEPARCSSPGHTRP